MTNNAFFESTNNKGKKISCTSPLSYALSQSIKFSDLDKSPKKCRGLHNINISVINPNIPIGIVKIHLSDTVCMIMHCPDIKQFKQNKMFNINRTPLRIC